jgi:hypothetical protein
MSIFNQGFAWIRAQTGARVLLIVGSLTFGVGVSHSSIEPPSVVSERLRRAGIRALPNKPAGPRLDDIPLSYWGADTALDNPFREEIRRRFKDSISAIIESRREEQLNLHYAQVESAINTKAPAMTYVVFYVGRALQVVLGLLLLAILWIRTARPNGRGIPGSPIV